MSVATPKKCGLKLIGWKDSRSCPTLLTVWSIVHFLSGISAYVIYRRYFSHRMSILTAFITWFTIHLAYESKDVFTTYGKHHSQEPRTSTSDFASVFNGLFLAENTLYNSMADQLVALLAFVVAHATCQTSMIFPAVTVATAVSFVAGSFFFPTWDVYLD